MIIDPYNLASAHSVIHNLLRSKTSRKVLLDFLADSIIQVHKTGERPGVWSVTLGAEGSFVRLNVGRIEVFAIFADTAHVILDYTKLSDTDAEKLVKLGSNYQEERPAYVRVPCSELWNIPANEFATAITIIRTSYQNLLEEAAASVRWRTGYHTSHSPGIVEFLRQELGRDIPDPNYDLTIIIEEVQKKLESTSDYVERKALLKRINALQKIQKEASRKR